VTTVYRLVNARHTRDAVSGEGARLYGGRWNPPGFPVVYASQSRALAVLETFVHLVLEARQLHFLLYEITLPKSARLQEYKGPESVWRKSGSPQITQEVGREWLAEGQTLALIVPSVIVPHETNFVVNVRHPEFTQLRTSKPEPFSLDYRLWK
jgi:RES domain-containing protein